LNALRHGEPRTVQISLAHVTGHALLSIRDDGRGFPDAVEPQRGFGLKSMRFRAGLLRGELQILRNEMHPLRGSGITLICRVPVHSRRLFGTTVV
jgi:signal transduction histidine kinase